MPEYLLSKSDFVLAHTCPTKLYYKKQKFPLTSDENEYLQYLARGGYMVGKLATLLYPTGVLIDTGADQQAAVRMTSEHMKKEHVTLFEAAIESKGKLIRVDILEKHGNKLRLIEVKSKSYETTDNEDTRKRVWRELEDYILDVAYQYFVITEAYPRFEVAPFLFLPDKAKRTKVDRLNLLFRIEQSGSQPGFRFKRYNVLFDDAHLKEVLDDDIMTLVDVEDRVLELQDLVRKEADILLFSLRSELKKIDSPKNKDCFKCEFSVIDDTHHESGFDICWRDFPKVDHHLRDLYHIGTIGGYKDPLVNRLIAGKTVSLFDVPMDMLTGKRGKRQTIQIDGTRRNKEWFSDDLRGIMRGWLYPLRFIDFETSIAALPFHKGMRPYEVVAFQWSCHTIEKPGAEPSHGEWINLQPEFPNFKFAESLMRHVGTEGTFFMWASYENTILKTIRGQCSTYSYSNSELRNWLEKVAKMDAGDTGMFVDLNKFTLENYFHPRMKGKTSIKWTLPAVLSSATSPRIPRWLEQFEGGLSICKRDTAGQIVNPYTLLPPIEIYDRAESVQDGTGAMRAYEDLMFGLNMGKQDVGALYSEALLRYCKLDTLAMVIIWEHWRTS